MKFKILIIEDEVIIAEDISCILSELGYEVVGVIHSSDKAIDYLSFHTPDLVLCDIMIKGPYDGIDVAATIRKKKKIPFVFLTSLSDRHTVSRAKIALPYGYIVKPFDEKDLLTTIEVALYKFSQELESLKITEEKINAIIKTHLTQKEYRILYDMINGLNYIQITVNRGISKNTLKYHTKNIFTKFGASNRAEVMQILLRHLMVQ